MDGKLKPAHKRRVGDEHYYRIVLLHDFGYGIDVKANELWLTPVDVQYDDGDEAGAEPGVEYQMATRFCKNARLLSTIDPRAHVPIHMKTKGGTYEEGMAIYSAIAMMPNPKTIISYTHARSMSSIILQAADWRVLVEHSYFMFHEGQLGISGTNRGVTTNVAWSKSIQNEAMLDIYVDAMLRKRGKQIVANPSTFVSRMLRCLLIEDKSRIDEAIAGLVAGYQKRKDVKLLIRHALIKCMDMTEDVFLTPTQAVDWGLADEVLEAGAPLDMKSLARKAVRMRRLRLRTLQQKK